MKKNWVFWVPVGVVAVAAFIALGGEVVLQLWNWLLPGLFGLPHITFWQALGLLALCRILFGGFGGGGMGRHDSRRRKAERWERMTPEEREKFRQGMRSSCGGFGAPPGGSNEPA